TVSNCHDQMLPQIVARKDQEADKESDLCVESEELEMQDLMEEAVSITEEDPEIQILRGLDNLLSRIEIMQCDIRLRQKLEGDEPQAEDQAAIQRDQAVMDECLGFPSNMADIRQLQRAQHQLQCQITELLRRYAHLRTQKRDLSHRWSIVQKKTAEIRELNGIYQKWMKDTSEEIAKCRKRSRQIHATKLTRKLATEVTETNIMSSYHYSQRYVLQNFVAQQLTDLRAELEEMRRFSDELAVEVDRRLEWIAKKAIKMG
ncbi:hypothetical protein KR038_010724, partial [Drosophila bunnanda]